MFWSLFEQYLNLSFIQRAAVSVVPLLFAITIHEVAHGWVAKKLGDPTAQRLGRLSLNPIKHVDPIGTVLLPAVLFLMKSNFIFGWAKPVPVTWENLRNPKRDMVIVALAGPLSNLGMALMWGIIVKIGLLLNPETGSAISFLIFMGVAGMFFNILLMVFNLLPLPPLDGGRVAVGLLPAGLSIGLSRLEPYGFFILIGLLYFGVFRYVIAPVVSIFLNLIAGISLIG